MPDLPLNSLEIRNFRAFDHLRIERLGRVNLIVGRNNVGKTSVLEALRLYSHPAKEWVLLNLLGSRDEIVLLNTSRYRPPTEVLAGSLERLFHRSMQSAEVPGELFASIGPADSADDTMNMRLELDSGGVNLVFSEYRKHSAYRMKLSINSLKSGVFDPEDYLITPLALDSHYIPTYGLARGFVESLWDEIALTDSEPKIADSLRIIAKNVERIVLRKTVEERAFRVPFVRLSGQSKPVPLRSMGEGVNRMFEFVLALVSCQGGILLIDEIENGLHYSVLTDLWRFLFNAAADFGVQIFATTHSSDCIRSFEEAAAESDEEGVLIQLARKDGKILVTELDERELGIAVEGDIEVRG